MPRLNRTGLAFQANHFNWTGNHADVKVSWRDAFPISNLDTVSVQRNSDDHKAHTNLDEVTLFLADGFRAGGRASGGALVEALAFSTEDCARTGDLGNAFVSLPVAGRRGQVALTAGQFSPLLLQYNPVNSLTDTLPFALSDDVDGFTLTEPAPGVRLDWFDNRERGTADGNYLTIALPYAGQLALNSSAGIHGANGVFAHAFRRHGYATLGVFGYRHAPDHLEGVIATRELRPNLYLQGVVAQGRDSTGANQRASGELEYVLNPRLALTGRLDGRSDTIGTLARSRAEVAAVTYYPLKSSTLRLTAETHQRAGDRGVVLFVRGQF